MHLPNFAPSHRSRKLLLYAAGVLACAAIAFGLRTIATQHIQSKKPDRTLPTRLPFGVSVALNLTPKISPGFDGPYTSLSSGTYIVRNASLRSLIRAAYRVREFQIADGPRWAASPQYKITIKTSGHPAIESWMKTIRATLQFLLKDRFQLTFHYQTTQLPAYALTLANNGVKLPRSQQTCTTLNWQKISRSHAPRSGEPCALIQAGPNIRLNHTLEANGISITESSPLAPGLITLLSFPLDRPVIDQTGLNGLFDVHLEWNEAATSRTLLRTASKDLAQPDSSTDADNPSIFTALKEQLGLKLEPAKAAVQIIYIDHATQPPLT